MNQLTIRTQSVSNTTAIDNYFIDTFMPSANGEFVKIYLYLIRIMNDPTCSLTLATIADYLEHTEKDILRGLTYWEQKGLLTITWDMYKNITAIDIVPITQVQPKTNLAPSIAIRTANTGVLPNLSEQAMMMGQEESVQGIEATTVLPTINERHKTTTKTNDTVKTNTVTELSTYNSKQEFKDILYITETYFGRVLSATDVDSLRFFYDELKLPASVIEYAVEYSVDRGHANMHYINKVAIAWAEEGISSVQEAKAQINNVDNRYYLILRSFGITNRAPHDVEKAFMNKWMNEYGFNLEIINAACEKTIMSISKVSFPYADAILAKWLKNKVVALEDIPKVDKEFSDMKAQNKAKLTNSTYQKPTTNNFEQRDYSGTFEDIEQQILQKALSS